MKNFKSDIGCVVCGDDESCWHHIRSRKSHPELIFDTRNLMSLCLKHHNEIHSTGTNTFIKKYQLENYMKQKGWDYDNFLRKWYLKNQGL